MIKAFKLFFWQNSPSVNTPLGENLLNQVNVALDEVDNRVVNLDFSKANQTDLLTTVSDLSYNESTGAFTVTKKNGSKKEIDTNVALYASQASASADEAKASAEAAEEINSNSKTVLDETKETLSEINKKVTETSFHVNLETGKLEYDSPNYSFNVNNSTGKLEWEVA